VDARVVNAADGDDHRLAPEFGDDETGHLEIAQHPVQ
jgi:hypothetical protein